LNTKLVPRDQVVANHYNPNSVSRDKMKLLKQSIIDNGFCFPIVTIWDESLEKYVIIDGFHRYTIAGPDWLDLDQVPIVVLDHDISKRMMATIQFNKAKGHHQVDLDAEVVKALLSQGLKPEEVAKHLGLDLETIHRYTQISRIADLFGNVNYSPSWHMEEVPND